MIREDRDVAFWTDVANHPAVKPHIGLGHEFSMEAVAEPQVTPLRTENGGFLFVRLDSLGRVQELHTMYRPEGWGREVLLGLKAAVTEMFARGAQLIVTYDVEGHWRSRPPKTFRFEPCADFASAPGFGVRFRSWVLTRAAWENSPAQRRSQSCLGS